MLLLVVHLAEVDLPEYAKGGEDSCLLLVMCEVEMVLNWTWASSGGAHASSKLTRQARQGGGGCRPEGVKGTRQLGKTQGPDD